MKNKVRIVLFDSEERIQEIWEVEVSERSRIFDTVVSHLKEFKDGHLRIEILKESKNIKFGDIVVSTDPAYPLRSATEMYSHAIVIQEQPLVLVSEESDMRWESLIMPEKLKVIGMANSKQLEKCMRRLEK